jgi:tRNA A-37 threonylcarbamoyl transferase component Bud32
MTDDKTETLGRMEIPLAGGNITAGVVRVGDTVRRPVSEWTPAVHALLRHLEEVGFSSSPRVLGFDEKGREVLTYLDGVSLSLDAPELLGSLETVWKAGALAADVAAALRTFVAPMSARWWGGSVDPLASSTIIHGDLAPWNVIVDGDQWGLIDWDFAGPARLVWEASYTLHTFGLLPAFGMSDAETVARIRSFGDGARLAASALADVLRLVPLRTRVNAEMIERLAAEGHPGYAVVQRKGHARAWRAASEHTSSRMAHWLAELNLTARG